MRTYGEIALETSGTGASWWRCTFEPQVLIRAKRVFPKVRKKASAMLIAATPENSRDLSWFCERYPVRMSEADAAALASRAEAHRQRGADVARILDGGYVPRQVALALPLREYQGVAVDLAERTRALLVADDVGLGKTATAIGSLANPENRPALVVTLTHLPAQWRAEIDRFLPGLRVVAPKTGTPHSLAPKPPRGKKRGQLEMAPDPAASSMPDIVVMNYHKLTGWAPELRGKVKTVIFDECQELRRGDSLKYDAAESVAAAAGLRIGLSATPIFNNGIEILNVMDVLAPGALGSRDEFETEWCTSGGVVKEPAALGAHLRESGLMLRRTREEVGRELPALTIAPHTIDVEIGEIESAMETGAAELARTILRSSARGWDVLQAAQEFDWRLRLATGLAKAPFVADFVRMLVESGESVLLGGWHHAVYEVWREKLQDLTPAFFTGAESAAQKEESRRRFTNGETKVLIMSLRAGAGLDGLQEKCSTVVLGEPDWSPSVHIQFIGRVHRDGQKRQVVAYFPLANAGSDPVIADALDLKRAQLEGIRDPNAPGVTLSGSDPERMRKLAADYLRQRGEKVEDEAAAADAAE